MEKKEPTLEQLENTIEVTTNSLKTAITPLGNLPEWQRIRMMEQAVAEAIADLRGVAYDLEVKRPAAIISIDLDIPHVCDDCQVTLNNLDANEHCHGCRNEVALMSYVPKDLRYRDPTEVSKEDDGPEQSRLEERIDFDP